jgi:hypothetical protein
VNKKVSLTEAIYLFTLFCNFSVIQFTIKKEEKKLIQGKFNPPES